MEDLLLDVEKLSKSVETKDTLITNLTKENEELAKTKKTLKEKIIEY